MNQNYNNERNAALDVLRNEMTFMQGRMEELRRQGDDKAYLSMNRGYLNMQKEYLRLGHESGQDEYNDALLSFASRKGA